RSRLPPPDAVLPDVSERFGRRRCADKSEAHYLGDDTARVIEQTDIGLELGSAGPGLPLQRVAPQGRVGCDRPITANAAAAGRNVAVGGRGSGCRRQDMEGGIERGG